MASRRISVELVGDAGDLERSLAGALASLKAFGDGANKSGNKASLFSKSTRDAERGLYDFDKAASQVNKTMSGGPFGLFDALGNVGYAILKLGGFAQDAEAGLGDLAKGGSTAEGAMAGLGSALTSLAPVIGVAVSGFAAVAAALVVLPALAAAATFVFVALLDTLTILAAVAAALAGPLTLLAALLGGLGAAFVLSGKKALAGKGVFKDFAGEVSRLSGMFQHLLTLLAGDFMPIFEQLVGAAKQAILYFDKLAKMPLKQAFQSLATDGVAMLSKFLYGVANVLKRPFRLAIQIAFGSGGATAQSAITGWWDSLTGYLFGYTKTHPVHIGSQIVMETKNIRGALAPIQKWFDRQHFVETGLRWAHEILDGLIRAWNHDAGLRAAVKSVLSDAGHVAGKAFSAAFRAEITNIPWRALGFYMLHQLDTSRQFARLFGLAWDTIRAKAGTVLHAITGLAGSAASAAGNAIKTALGNAWQWVRAKAIAVWNAIKSFVESALTVHINWPSPPSWLSKLGGGAGSLLGGAFSRLTATGGIVTGPQVRVVGEAGPEAIIPLTGAAGRSALTQIGSGGGGATTVNLVLDRKVLASVMVDADKAYSRQNAGRGLF